MRRSFILFPLGPVLLLAGSGACGGNVVVDGQGGAGGTATTTTTLTSGQGGGVANPGETVGSGAGGSTTSCESCASRVSGGSVTVVSMSAVCPGASQDAFDALTSCVCGTTCQASCTGNVCIGAGASTPCTSCVDASCKSEIVACSQN